MAQKLGSSEVIVRQAKQEDMKAVTEMIQELADFEKMPDGPKLTVKDLKRDCFELQPPAFRCKVAEVSDAGSLCMAGYAIYFPTYSTWEGRALLLEDLCVRTHYRRRGVGERLFTEVAKEAAAIGSRLDFHVLEWNPACAFYESLGAENLTKKEQWCYYRVAGDSLRRLVDGPREG